MGASYGSASASAAMLLYRAKPAVVIVDAGAYRSQYEVVISIAITCTASRAFSEMAAGDLTVKESASARWPRCSPPVRRVRAKR